MPPGKLGFGKFFVPIHSLTPSMVGSPPQSRVGDAWLKQMGREFLVTGDLTSVTEVEPQLCYALFLGFELIHHHQ
jgi:hypothetical protein